MSFRHLFLHWTYESFPPGRLLRSRYNAFRRLMDLEEETMSIIAEIEEIDFGRVRADWQRVEWLAETLGLKVREMLEQLQTMNPVRFMDIMDYYSKINFYTRMAVTVPDPEISEPFIYPLEMADMNRSVSGIPALHLCRALKREDIRVPESTVLSANIYHYFAEANDLRNLFKRELSLINPDDDNSVKSVSARLVNIIEQSRMPALIANEMEIAALELAKGGKSLSLTASATPDDGKTPLEGVIHTESDISPADIVSAWKRAVTAKYSPTFLKKRISASFADGETPVVVIISSGYEKGLEGELMSKAPEGESLPPAEEENGCMSVSCRNAPASSVLISRREKHRIVRRDDSFPLSPHILHQLADAATALENDLGLELRIRWRTDSRKRLAITAVAPLKEDLSKSFDRFGKALPHIARLNLPAAGSDSFMPERSRSMYDLVRFANEKGIAEMFSLVSKEGLGLDGSKILRARIPVALNILNLADGLFTTAAGKLEISSDDIKSVPMWALWFGLDSEKAKWNSGKNNAEADLHGYAILARTYMNMTMKFSREFAEVDAVCGPEDETNHINFRFKGGSGTPQQRLTRIEFMTRVLESQGFGVKRLGDLIEAAQSCASESRTQKRLATLGILISMAATDSESISSPEKSEQKAAELIGSVS